MSFSDNAKRLLGRGDHLDYLNMKSVRPSVPACLCRGRRRTVTRKRVLMTLGSPALVT